MFLPVSDVILGSLIIILLTLSICQHFTKRAALKISELLYIMSKNVREKAVMVREYGKDMEILEAHLFDINASARSLLEVLGHRQISLELDPSLVLSMNGKQVTSKRTSEASL